MAEQRRLATDQTDLEWMLRETELRFDVLEKSLRVVRDETLNLARVHQMAHEREHVLGDQAVAAALSAAQGAVDKAERAQELRNSQQNEWRAALTDANSTFALKSDFAASGVRVEQLLLRITTAEGRVTGNSERLSAIEANMAWLARGVLGLVASVIGAVAIGFLARGGF